MAKGLTQLSWQVPSHWRKPLALLAAEAGTSKQSVLIAAIACLYRLPEPERLALISGIADRISDERITSLAVTDAASHILGT